MTNSRWHIRPFSPTDQAAAKALILAGLEEHWGELDLSLNPDLNDIQDTFVDSGVAFLVVEVDGKLVGTGALIPEGEDAARIVRVSVEKNFRRQGMGQAITARLVEVARQSNYTKILVETTETWEPAIHLYQNFGFEEVNRYDGEVHMQMVL